VIARLRRALLSAIGRSRRQPTLMPREERSRSPEAARRLDAAHTRLKSTIPPPAE